MDYLSANKDELQEVMDNIRKRNKFAVEESTANRKMLADMLETTELNRQLFYVASTVADKFSDCYLLPAETEGKFLFVNTELTAGFVVHAGLTNSVTKKFVNDPISIHAGLLISFKKGNGKKMITKLIEASESCNAPITGWVETEELLTYWAKYGFKNHGKHGKNKEWLIIRKPVEKLGD